MSECVCVCVCLCDSSPNRSINSSSAGFAQDYVQHCTYLFVNYEMGQKFTKVPSNHSLGDTSSVLKDCGKIWLLRN